MSNPATPGGSTATDGGSVETAANGTQTEEWSGGAVAVFITIIVIAVGSLAITGLFIFGSDAGMAIADISVNDSAGPGEAIVVTVTVENTGDEIVTDEIALQIGDTVSQSRDVQLGPGESTSISFDVERTENLTGETSLTVSSSFDRAESEFSIREAAIDIEVRNVSDPIVEGQDLLVEAVLTNSGSSPWSDGVVSLQTNDGVIRDSAEVTVNPGEETTIELVWETDSGASSFTDISVHAGARSTRTAVDIQPVGGSPFFIVDIVDAAETMTQGENSTLTASIENLAGVGGTTTVRVSSPGFENLERTLEIGGGESISETFSLDAMATGTHTVTVSTADAQSQRQITVLEPGNLQIASLTANNPTEGDPLEISFTVSNTGETPVSGTIDVDGGSLGFTNVQFDLEDGEETEKSTSISTSAGDSGSHTVTLTYNQQTTSTTVSVQEANDDDDDNNDNNDSQILSLAISSISPADPVAGQEFTVTFEVTNTGEFTRPDTVQLSGNGVESAQTEITIGAGATESATISSRFDTNIQQATIIVETTQFGGADSRTVDLQSYAFGTTTAVDLDPGQDVTVTSGEEIGFSATAIDSFGNQFTDDGQFTWQADGGEISSTGTFSELDAGQYAVTAGFEGATSPATTVTVEESGVETVEIEPATDRILTAGTSLNFEATARDAQGNIIQDSAQAFSWNGPVTDAGEFTAVETGEYAVSASYNGVSSSPTGVTVEPASVDQVTISGDLQPTAGETTTFDATAADQYGNVIETDNTAFEWSGENVSSGGEFQSETASEQDVTATYDGTSATVTVAVQPAAAATVEIEPAEDKSIFSGQELRFQAAAYDQYGNLVLSQDSQFTWDASGGNITDTGIFEETSTGTYDVTATYNGIISDPTTVTVS